MSVQPLLKMIIEQLSVQKLHEGKSNQGLKANIIAHWSNLNLYHRHHHQGFQTLNQLTCFFQYLNNPIFTHLDFQGSVFAFRVMICLKSH